LAAHAFYYMMVPLMRLALAVHFRRLHVLHADAFPKKGAVLVVANHPSRWTDVVVLDIALRRGLHYLAGADQFHPWPRGALMRLYGALPVFDRTLRPDYSERNARTFRRCEWLFDVGEGVPFPEG
jgi:1-acyl-sn-glycerol-3-phosphate acyltransferase